jgi:hypothetical protein
MRRLRLFALLLALSSWSLSQRSLADDGVAAVLPFAGPQSAKVRQNVQKGLREAGVNLVPLKKVTGVARKVKGYANQARRLDATVLVKARVRRVEGRWVVDVGVRNAKGQRIDRVRSSSSSLSRVTSRLVTQLLKTGHMPRGGVAADAPPPAPAPPDEPRVVIRPFKGTQASKVRVAAIRGLREEPIEFYPNSKFVAEADRLGANLGSDVGHVEPARSLAVSGLFEGDVLREDGVWSAYIRLVDGRSKNVVSQHYYDASTLSALMKVIQIRVGSDFHKDLRKLGVRVPGEAPAVPVAAVAPEASERDSEKAEPVVVAKAPKPAREKAKRPAAVDIEAEFRIVNRRLRYNDVPESETDLRDYTLRAGPGVGLKFQYFPGAHFTSGIGAQFGIDFEWERLIGIDSARTNPDGTVSTFPTKSQQFLVDVRWRYPKGRWEPFVVLGYGFHNFQFSVSGPPVPGEDNTAGVPGVRYRFVRLGTGFRVGIGKKETFVIAGNIAMRFVGDRVGGIGSQTWFPDASANGLDTGIVFGFALPLGFEVRLGVDYRRYWFDLNPVPPDAPFVAGGALDRYVGGTVGFAWRH